MNMFRYMSCIIRKPVSNQVCIKKPWSDTNQAVQPQKMARSLNFQIKEVEGLYYLCSENKGTQISCAVTAQLICFVFA